jgi:hypothetical protein
MRLTKKNNVQKLDCYDFGFDLFLESGVLYLSTGEAIYVDLDKLEVRQLINYLQNWVDTGNFEGKKEAESND